MVFATRSDFNGDQYAFVEKLIQQYDPFKRRYPASLALLMSPICLLVPKKILSRVMAQDTLLKVRFLPP
jgi:hypothetical protein